MDDKEWSRTNAAKTGSSHLLVILSTAGSGDPYFCFVANASVINFEKQDLDQGWSSRVKIVYFYLFYSEATRTQMSFFYHINLIQEKTVLLNVF